MENPNKKFPAGNKKYISLHTLKSRDSTQLKQTEGKFGTEGGSSCVKLLRSVNKLDIKLSNTVFV